MVIMKTITREEVERITRRLMGKCHDLIKLDFFHYKCKRCSKMFTFPYHWMDTTKIIGWIEQISNEKC